MPPPDASTALNLPPWTVPVHAIVWFFAISACWIAAGTVEPHALNCTCSHALRRSLHRRRVRGADATQLSATSSGREHVNRPARSAAQQLHGMVPFARQSRSSWQCSLLHSGLTTAASCLSISPCSAHSLFSLLFPLQMGANGKNLTNVFWNGTATAAFARKIDKANADGRAIAACEARLSPTVGGVFILTLAMLFYTIWRRGQIRRALLLPGDLTMDFVLWLFWCASRHVHDRSITVAHAHLSLCSTQCVLCQEYRTMRRNHVLEGKWAAGNSWLLDFTSSQATNTKAPAYVEMV